ncbi:MAG TPA: TonB-dependent receptor [Vicinamibacteria bacterium]|nr:TonB-dependent receptor [Vicinamibacteria bacterium]
MIARRLTLAVLLALVAAVPLVAQTQLGSVVGTVLDEQGGVLPGVTVNLVGPAGTRTAMTDAAGAYRFPAVTPGTYELRAEMSGFRPGRVANVVVPVAGTATADMTIKVGGLTEEVDVVGESPLVDTTSTATDNTLSQDLLYNMPIDRRSFNIYNFAPGISNDAAFGAGSSTANALLLDGVDTRDPEGGTDWTFYNYNIIDQVQIQGLGAPAEYGSYTGAVVNTVTKSGTNRYAALFDLNYTKGSWASDNVPKEIAEINPALSEPAVTNKYLDVTAQLSGPIKKDKAFFFFSAQRYLKDDDPTGPRTTTEEISHRANLKLSFNPGASDQLVAAVQFDDYNIRGRCDLDSDFLCRDELTDNEDAPEWVWNLQWRHLFGTKTFLEAKLLGWWGYYYLDPVNNLPGHLDGATGAYSVSYGKHYYADRSRNQVNASLSHYAEGFGKHDLKFGVEIERSKVRSRWGYTDNIFYYDYYGEPYYAYSYSYDIEGRNQRESVYAQDSWKPTDRLTINAGLRFDWIRGRSPILDKKVYDTKSWGPRIGVAYDLTGDHKTVLKGFFGQYYEGAAFLHYSFGVPGINDFVGYDNTSGELVEVDRTVTPVARIDPDIKKPRVDEFTLGIEREIGRDFRIQATGIYRKYRNYSDVLFPSARWEPVEATNELTGQPVTVYSWANRSESDSDYFVTNPEGFGYQDPSGVVFGTAHPYRNYKGLMLVLTKRFTNRWQTQASYVYSQVRGTWDNDNSNSYGSSYRWASPTTALVNTDGKMINDPTHEVKVYATYQVPKIEVGINAYFRSITGQTYTPYQQLSSGDLNFPQSSRGRRLLLEPRGSRRLDTQNLLDLRLEKIVKLGGGSDKLGLYLDIRNVFNSDMVNEAINRYPSSSTVDAEGNSVDVPFGTPSGLVDPRQVTLGLRWSF